MPGGGARFHADSPEGDIRGHRHRALGGSASPRRRRRGSQTASPRTRPASRDVPEAVVQRLPVFGQPPDSEQCGRVLRAGMEAGEEAQEAESSPCAAGASTSSPAAATTAAEDASQPHARSRTSSQVETPSGETKGTQPQDPRTGAGPSQRLTFKKT